MPWSARATRTTSVKGAALVGTEALLGFRARGVGSRGGVGAPPSPVASGRCLRRPPRLRDLAHAILGAFVVAQSQKGRMAEPAVLGPLGESDLADELRL